MKDLFVNEICSSGNMQAQLNFPRESAESLNLINSVLQLKIASQHCLRNHSMCNHPLLLPVEIHVEMSALKENCRL